MFFRALIDALKLIKEQAALDNKVAQEMCYGMGKAKLSFN